MAGITLQRTGLTQSLHGGGLLLLVLTAGVLLGGCRTAQSEANQAPTRGTAEETGEAGWSDKQLAAIVPSSVTYDVYGANLLAAVQFRMGPELDWATANDEIRHLQLFNNSFGGYQLLPGTDSTGLSWILAERSLAGSSWEQYFTGRDIPQLRDPAMTPATGFIGGIERHAVIGTETANPIAAEAGPGTSWSDRWAIGLGPLDPQLPVNSQTFRNRPPQITGETRLLGFLARQFMDLSFAYANRGEPWHAATGLDQLAEAYGGVNADAWINPYTGESMERVLQSEATAGDYSVLESPEGVQLGLHYLDAEGQVSTFYVGFQGTHDIHWLDNMAPPPD